MKKYLILTLCIIPINNTFSVKKHLSYQSTIKHQQEELLIEKDKHFEQIDTILTICKNKPFEKLRYHKKISAQKKILLDMYSGPITPSPATIKKCKELFKELETLNINPVIKLAKDLKNIKID